MKDKLLVFISHSTEDKKEYIEPIVKDLEDAYFNIWIDSKNIIPGRNLERSIFNDGLDKADIVLLFFTNKSLKSFWVNEEVEYILNQSKKQEKSNFNKIISIFDSKNTYDSISNKYPELTNDLLHLMPLNYQKKHLTQLISAIWFNHSDLIEEKVMVSIQKVIDDRESFVKEMTVKIEETTLMLSESRKNRKRIFS